MARVLFSGRCAEGASFASAERRLNQFADVTVKPFGLDGLTGLNVLHVVELDATGSVVGAFGANCRPHPHKAFVWPDLASKLNQMHGWF